MKIVAIIPIKSKSERVKNKNFKKVNGKPLYKFLLEKLKRCNFDEIYIDSDSKEIKKYCIKNNYKFIQRLPKLSKNDANGNDLLNYHSKIIQAPQRLEEKKKEVILSRSDKLKEKQEELKLLIREELQ